MWWEVCQEELSKTTVLDFDGSPYKKGAMESKEALLKMLEEHGELSQHLKQAWKSENMQDTQNFMKNGVLVTMTSEDIVRKAKALADSNADKWKKKTAADDEEEWNTILHAENKQAKMLITANKVRLKDLKRRMAELQKRREREKERLSPRKPYADVSDESIKANDPVNDEIIERSTLDKEKSDTSVSKNNEINIDDTTAVNDNELTAINNTEANYDVETIAITEAETTVHSTETMSSNITKTAKSDGTETTATIETVAVNEVEASEVDRATKTFEGQNMNERGKVDKGMNNVNIKTDQYDRVENKDSNLDTETAEEQEMHDSFNFETDQELKITKSPSAPSRPDSAIGSMGSEDTVFDTAAIEATESRKLEE